MMEQDQSVTLKEFFIEKLTSLEKSTEAARVALEKNVETARSALEKNTEVSRLVLEKRLDRLEGDIRILRESKATNEGGSSKQAAIISTGIAVLGVIVSVLILFIRQGR